MINNTDLDIILKKTLANNCNVTRMYEFFGRLKLVIPYEDIKSSPELLKLYPQDIINDKGAMEITFTKDTILDCYLIDKDDCCLEIEDINDIFPDDFCQKAYEMFEIKDYDKLPYHNLYFYEYFNEKFLESDFIKDYPYDEIEPQWLEFKMKNGLINCSDLQDCKTVEEIIKWCNDYGCCIDNINNSYLNVPFAINEIADGLSKASTIYTDSRVAFDVNYKNADDIELTFNLSKSNAYWGEGIDCCGGLPLLEDFCESEFLKDVRDIALEDFLIEYGYAKELVEKNIPIYANSEHNKDFIEYYNYKTKDTRELNKVIVDLEQDER